MKLLLDTHVLLWAMNDPERLSPSARKLILDPESELFFSAASMWEIALKNSLGRHDFQVDGRRLRRSLLDNGYLELPITSEHTLHLESLPPLHKDPFDRILIAQARTEGILLITADSKVAGYRESIRRV